MCGGGGGGVAMLKVGGGGGTAHRMVIRTQELEGFTKVKGEGEHEKLYSVLREGAEGTTFQTRNFPNF